MKRILLLLISLFLLALLQMGCDSTSPDKDKYFAYLELYWNNLIHYSEILTEEDEGFSEEVILPDDSTIILNKFAYRIVTIPDEEEVWKFGCLATKSGFYSLIPKCDDKDTLRIYGDTGFTAVEPGMICGLVYNKNYGIIASTGLLVLDKADSTLVTTIQINQHGRYAMDLPFGEYLISYDDEIIEFKFENLYHDIELKHVEIAYKPNIYLYPEQETMLDVKIDFPKGGVVTVSDPDYGEGWNNITVTPQGIINDKHDFLFYESATSDFEIPEKGWVLAQTDLEEFFIRNMKATGFKGREIDDFIEFWIPIFKEHKFYEIYPLYQKELDEKIVLNCSQQPDNMQRLIYIVKGRADNVIKLAEPKIPAFERKGFVVTEWGVIRKD